MKKSLLLLLPTLFLVASCGQPAPDPVHEHTFSSAWSSDKTNHWHECSCGEKSELAAHVDSDDNALCDICGAQIHKHSFSTTWKYNATQHWHSCSCGEKADVADHIDQDQNLICDICGGQLPAPHVDPCPDGQHVDADQDMVCDICGYPVEYQHATKIKETPAAPFFLKVGEEKTISVTLEPAPQRDVEKTISWKISDDTVASLEVKENTKYATITALKTGSITITATNDYNTNLVATFEATVIEFDDSNMYLWEYNSNDKSQFGYTSDNKAGNTSGEAILNGLTWDFTRSEAISLNTTKSGMIGFGKGSAPETRVELINNNKRKIRKIEVEAISANALANLTVKIGETEVINCATPSTTSDVVVPLVSETLADLTGNISLLFETPQYEPEKAEDIYYKAPGAFYLKSIMIYFGDKAEDIPLDLVKVKNNELGSGKYLLTIPESKALLKGSSDATALKNKDGIETLPDVEFGDELSLASTYEKEMLILTKSGDYYKIANNNSKVFGLTGKNGLSIAGSPEYSNWEISVNEDGIASLKIVGSEDKVFYYGFVDDVLKISSSDPGNLSLYKIA